LKMVDTRPDAKQFQTVLRDSSPDPLRPDIMCATAAPNQIKRNPGSANFHGVRRS